MVSVIIPNWNGKHLLEECLGSLRAQTFQDLEIILVDNGSTDRSVEFVARSFPEVKIIELRLNSGFSRAVNEGIKASKAEFIALLNNDAIADEKWIEELLEGIHSSKEVGFCASQIVWGAKGTEIDAVGDVYTRYGVAIKRRREGETNPFLQKELVFGACGAASLYRRSMLEEVGYFDEDFFCIYEDVDLSFRAQLSGFKCLYVPTAIVYHRVGGTMGRNNDFILYYGQRNLEFVFIKNMPFSLTVKYLPLHIEYVILAFLYHILRNKGGIFLRSKIDVLKQIGCTLKKRWYIQSRRKVSSRYLETLLYKRSLLKHILERG